MPRKGRGGSRQGTPGTAYANRTDLAVDRAPAQPARAPAGQTYGDRQAQEQAQAMVPLPDLAAQTGALPALTDPTMRPAEPLTAGAPFGPGPGPITPPDNTGLGVLRRMLAVDPDPELFALLAEGERAKGGIAPAVAMPRPTGERGGGVWAGQVLGGLTPRQTDTHKAGTLGWATGRRAKGIE